MSEEQAREQGALEGRPPYHLNPDELGMPQLPVCLEALEIAYKQLSTPILNHSMRVHKYARWLIENGFSINNVTGDGISYSWDLPSPKPELVFLACIFHDLGTAEEQNKELRFEVEGGNAAARLLKQHGFSDSDAREVWIAISCHTSPHIVERIGPLAAVVRAAVIADFSRIKYGKDHEMAEQFEKYLPRLGIEDVLARAVVGQCIHKPEKAPHVSWPHALLQGHQRNPDYEGVNPEF